jgi:hypothetical protein
MQTARRVPVLKDLVANARPVFDKTNTATNYSMIADRFASYDERWVSIGDAAYFVDPLFSSGVAFSVNHAASAALLIELAFSETVSEADKRDLFRDYDEGWRGMACSFAVILDQWYHAIARTHSNSIYWETRTSESLVDVRLSTFNDLVDTAVSPDLLMVITKGEGKLSELTDGPLVEALRLAGKEPRDDQRVALKNDVVVRPSVSLAVGLSKINLAMMREGGLDRLRAYWADPVNNRQDIPRLYDKAIQQHRFERDDHGVGFLDQRDGGFTVAERLRTPTRYGDVRSSLSPAQRLLVRKLRGANMMDIDDEASAAE